MSGGNRDTGRDGRDSEVSFIFLAKNISFPFFFFAFTCLGR